MPRYKKPVIDLCSRQRRRRNYDSFFGTAEETLRPSDGGLAGQRKYVDTDIAEPSDCNISVNLDERIECDTEAIVWRGGGGSGGSSSDGDVLEFFGGDSECQLCRTCLCISCEECFHGNSCSHCDMCKRGFEGFHDDLSYPVSSEDERDGQEDGEHENLGGNGREAVEHASFSGDRQESDQDACKSNSLAEALITWAFMYNITLVALSDLLKILKTEGMRSDLPADARTLLKTPRYIDTINVFPGLYWHYGLAKGLQKLLYLATNLGSTIKYSIGIDGIPISASSGSSLWPILCLVKGFGMFVVGSYHGKEKPKDSNEFLCQFIKEASELATSGLEVGKRTIRCVLEKLICDAPAKSFVLKIKGHNAYHGCTRCITEGNFAERRMAYLDNDAPLRTNESFHRQDDDGHHLGTSDLLSISGFNPVSGTVLDYMHLVCLGVTRKLLNLWLRGPIKVRIPNSSSTAISNALESVAPSVPREFARKTRSLKYLRQWKATEFRLFLLYAGPVVLLRNLPKRLYEHFLSLHVAVTIMCSQSLTQDKGFVDYAESLLKYFVREFGTLYGREFCSHNVHNLIHIVDDVRKFGPLDAFSAFPFENYLQELKALVRKGDKPLLQVARRYTERSVRSVKPKKTGIDSEFHRPHHDGPLPHGCQSPQFKRVNFQNFSLGLDSANNCCLMEDKSVVHVENFAFSNSLQSMVVIGRAFKTKRNLYKVPCPSSSLGVFKVEHLSGLKVWPVKSVSGKCVRFAMSANSYAVFTLLHTCDIE